MTRKTAVGILSAGVVLAIVAAVLAMLLLSTGRNDAVVQQVKNILTIVTGIQKTFGQGRLVAEKSPDSNSENQYDARATIISTSLAKLQYNIEKRKSGDARQQAILAELAAAQKLMAEFMPKYLAAVESNETSLVKEFSGCMTTLQQHLNKILEDLQS